MEAVTQVSVEEIVRLGALNDEIYEASFFPKTKRQASPPYWKLMGDVLNDPLNRLVNFRIFRGGAKTTKARLYTSKRIAYGLSKVILYIGANEPAAIRSIRWLKAQVTKNTLWARTFGLSKGDKWSENEAEIIQVLPPDPTTGTPGEVRTIWILGVGITSSSLRGINFDDYRPDTIICDDILDDENTQTEAQRNNISKLLHGAIKNSLAPATEEPNAKMIMLVTAQHKEDAASKATNDPRWRTLVIGCWTEETKDLPVEEQVSIWPERYTSESLRADKMAALAQNDLALFAREMECRLISAETAEFRSHWLRIYDRKPKAIIYALGIDPVPPPTKAQQEGRVRKKDWEVIHVWGRKGPDYFLLESRRMRGHNPNWTIANFFELLRLYPISKAVVETVAYQATLKWLLEREMERRRIYVPIIPYVDTRPKPTRISTTFAGLASAGHIWIGPEHTEFATQFETYPDVDKDDDLDCGAITLSELVRPHLELMEQGLEDDDLPTIEYEGACP